MKAKNAIVRFRAERNEMLIKQVMKTLRLSRADAATIVFGIFLKEMLIIMKMPAVIPDLSPDMI